uniref:Calponin-homology (CH) domain-containing protein n=1 Tax=Syphacia muris TaxID=451379 RepID=A0A0N5ABU1_9BILA
MSLIWQIILYFQIENNVQLLREWGFELDGSGSSTSGITDETGACNNSSILNDQIHIGHIKVPIEKVFLRWINAQVSKTYGITVHDMDSFWKDGVVFNALIHKVRPDLVDMDEVCNSEPKQNLERAFRLARDHLHIHPLLEIDDMLIDMPDKRSVMAYVSQFIRLPSMCKPVSAESCCDLQSLSTWLHKAYSTLTKSSDESLYDRYQIYLTLRKEFVDHQHNYYLSRKEFPTSSSHHSACFYSSWTKVGELLSKWSHRLEDELPGSLSDLSQWLCAAEQTISRPFELVAEDADHSLVRIKEAQETIKKLSVDYSQSYEKFQTIYFNKRVGDKEISIEFLEPLKIRFDALGRGIADLLKDLDVSHSYYLVFAFIEQLNKKMAFWKSGDSANLVKRWIKEYKVTFVECNTFPEKKLHAFIENFAIVISSADKFSVSDESKEWLLVKCKEASKECIKNFNEFGRYLDSLLTYWKEFELYTSKVEEVVSKSEREKRNLLGADINDLLRKCGKARDAISRMSSASGRNAVNMRLASLRQRVDEIGRTPLCTEEKVNTKVVVPQSRSPWKSLIKLRSDRPSTSKVLRSSTPVHMMEWIKSVKELLSSTVSSLDQLDFLMQKLVEYQKEMHAVESERIALLKSAGHNQQNITEFRKLKNDLRVRSQQLKIVRPIFVEFEKSYNNLSDLVVHPKASF